MRTHPAGVPFHPLARAAALACCVACSGFALAQGADAPGPREPALLPHTGSECLQVPDCVAVGGDTTSVPVDRTVHVARACPASHPYVWHWDTEQHVHVAARLVGRTRGALTFSLANQGSSPGEARILIGCSTRAFDAHLAGVQTSRTGARPRSAPLSPGAAR